MLFLGLALGALLLQADARPADSIRLHPADADLYVEVPNVSSLLHAYADAPTARFVADPDVQKLGALTQQLGYDLGALTRGVMPRLSDPKSADLFDGGDLQDISISLRGIDRRPDDSADISQRIGLLVVCDFATERGAEHMTQALRDSGWVFDRAPSVETPPVSGAKETESKPVAPSISLDGVTGTIQEHRLQAPLLELDSWSVRLGRRWIFGAGRSTSNDLMDRVAGKRPSLPARDVLFAGEKTFTPSSGTLVARLHADMETIPLTGLGDPSPFMGTLITSFLPFAGARGEWRIEMRGQRFVMEGLSTRLAPATPLDGLYGDLPVARASALYVPKEAVGAWVMQLQPAKLPAALDALFAADAKANSDGAESSEPPAGEPSPVESKEAAAAAKERHAKIEAAFARSLGTNAAISLLPFSNIQSFVPRILVTLELKDRDAFQAGLRDLVLELKERHPKLTIDDRPYHKIPVTVFSDAPSTNEAAPAPGANPLAGAMNLEANVKPSIAVLADRVVIALSPTQIRSEIQRLEKKPIEGAALEIHSIAAEGRIPSDAVEASTIDWAGLFGKLYDLARGFAPMLAQNGALPFDPATLPQSSNFTKFFQPSFAWSKKREGRLYTYSESSFGPETPLTLIALARGVTQAQGDQRPSFLGGGGPAGDRAAPTPPSESKSSDGKPASGDGAPTTKKTDAGATAPVKDEARDKTLIVLRSVKTGIAVYRSQSGRAPEALAQLLVGTDNFPKGFLDPPAVPKDAWGRDLRYAPETGGAKYKLWSLGPDGIDQEGAGDDITVP